WNMTPRPVNRPRRVGGLMVAFEYTQQVGRERLRAQAQAIDAVVGQNADFGLVESAGIGLDGELMTGKQGEPGEYAVQQGFQLRGAQLRGSAAAEKQGTDRLGPSQATQLRRESVDVFSDAVVLTHRNREVAVAAVMSAKRYMHISGSRPAPGRARI